MKFEIKSRYDQSVLYTADIPDDTESGLQTRVALEQATAAKVILSGAYLRDAYLSGAYLRGAYLNDADLSGADLSGADLSGAYLRDADLSGADLSGAYLRDADLSGADLNDADLSGADLSGAYLNDDKGNPLPRATPEQAIENLDKVREIILDNIERLDMGVWHEGEGWRERTCAEEAVCGTSHCLAGWLQVCSMEPALKDVSAELAGILSAPVACKMFYRDNAETLDWLKERKYVEESK